LLNVRLRHRPRFFVSPFPIVLESTARSYVTDGDEECGRNPEIAEIFDGPGVVSISVVKCDRCGDLIVLSGAEPLDGVVKRDHRVIVAQELDLSRECDQGQTQMI